MTLITDQCTRCHRLIPAPGLCASCDQMRRACHEAFVSLALGIVIAACIGLLVAIFISSCARPLPLP